MPSVEEYLEKSKLKKKKDIQELPPIDIRLEDTSYMDELLKDSFKEETKNKTEEEQLGSNKVAIREQLGSNKVATKVAIREQLGSNNLSDLICKLYGNERKFIFYIFEICKNHCSLKTNSLTRDIIKEDLCLSSKNLVGNIINRVVKKGLLERFLGKRGRGGWMIFQFPKHVYSSIQNISNQKLTTNNNENISNKVATKVAISSSSSSNILLNTTTKELPLDWLEINISQLKDIGFSKIHLTQIFIKTDLTPEIVQDAINAFAFDLEKNNKAKNIISSSGPLGFFMGILTKGMPYTPPPNYISPKAIAMKAYLEQVKKETFLEQEIVNIEFEKWRTDLSIEEEDSLIPEIIQNFDKNSTPRISELKKHFKENIWSKKKKEFLKI